MGNMRNEQDWAIFLAAVCGQTYAQFEHADGSFVVPADFSVVHNFRAKSMGGISEPFGFILESPQEIIIAWRGSSSTTNWLSNMNAAQKKFKYIKEDCLTHRGFTDIYSSAREEILSILGTLSPEKTVYVTGHSLGGALATLCAIDIAANSAYRSPRLYTYGSPRAGDPAFAKAFSSYVRSSFRYANLFDVATYVPPTIYKLPRHEKNTITPMCRRCTHYLSRTGRLSSIMCLEATSQYCRSNGRNTQRYYVQGTPVSVRCLN